MMPAHLSSKQAVPVVGLAVLMIAGTCCFAPPRDNVENSQMKRLPEMGKFTGHLRRILALAFSPDGALLASASCDHTIRIWDLATLHIVATLEGHKDEVYSAVFSPDGKLLFSSSWDGTIKCWDTSRWKEEGGSPTKSKWGVTSLALSPDGNTLASAVSGPPWDVTLWDLRKAWAARALHWHENMVDDISFSPDGKKLISASTDCTATIWEVSTGKELHTLHGHDMAVSSARFSPDGKTIASGSDDGTVRLWDATSGDATAVWTGYKNGVGCNCLSFSRDGALIFAGYGDVSYSGASDWGLLSARDSATGKEQGPFLCGASPISCLAVSPDGAILATGSREGVIIVWDIRALTGTSQKGADKHSLP